MQGKRVLITGGSAGVGGATAIRLAQLGAICAVNFANNETRAKELLLQLHGNGHQLVQGSVFTKPEAREVVRTSIAALGGLDCIVSNAGWTKVGDFKDLEALVDEDWDKCYAANVKAHLWIMQAAREELTKNKGSFVITASLAGIKPSGSSMAYSVSKAAAIHLAASLAKACAPEITVNSISPGLLKTDWTKSWSAGALHRGTAWNALQKLAEADDCAHAIIMLLQSRSITGQNIEISAGYQL